MRVVPGIVTSYVPSLFSTVNVTVSVSFAATVTVFVSSTLSSRAKVTGPVTSVSPVFLTSTEIVTDPPTITEEGDIVRLLSSNSPGSGGASFGLVVKYHTTPMTLATKIIIIAISTAMFRAIALLFIMKSLPSVISSPDYLTFAQTSRFTCQSDPTELNWNPLCPHVDTCNK